MTLKSWRSKDAEQEDQSRLKKEKEELGSLEKRRSRTEFLFGKSTAEKDNSVYGYNPSRKDIEEARDSVKRHESDEKMYARDRGYTENR